MSIDKKFLNLFIKVTEIAKTEKAFGSPFAVNLVPSKGSTAISNLGPLSVPSFSPIYNIGASSISPSPITTFPSILILFNSLLIGSTAPLSAAILSFFPMNFDAPIAAFSVLAISEKGGLLSAPDTYMEKIVIGSNLPKNLMDIDNGVEKNIKLLAEAKNKKISELKACVLKRPRHDDIVKQLTKLNVKINYITDGDIAGALSVIGDTPANDIYYSTGGAPEGVVVAAALSCYGGQIQGRLVLDSGGRIRAKKLGINEFDKKYNIDDMVKGDVIFCATGVTDGDLAKGVKDLGNEFEVNTFVLHKSRNIIKSITNIYNK